MKRTKTLSATSFAVYDVERRIRKGSFYAQVDAIIDWKPISAIIDQHYKKGLSTSGELPEGEVEKQEHFFKEVAEDGVDKEARWLKKGIFCLKSSRKKRYKKEHNFEFSNPYFLKKIIRI